MSKVCRYRQPVLYCASMSDSVCVCKYMYASAYVYVYGKIKREFSKVALLSMQW
jgi:hypothetical protein